MNSLKLNDITLDLNLATATFRLNGEVGITTRTTYTGTFTVRAVLDPSRELAAGRMYRALLGPQFQQASDHEANLAFALSQLQQRVLTAPPWFDSTPGQEVRGSTILDSDILLKVLDLSVKAQEEYAKALKEESKAVFENLRERVDLMDKAENEQG